MNKKILLGTLIVALVIGIVFFIRLNQKSDSSNTNIGTPNIMANGSSANLESLNPNNDEDSDNTDEDSENTGSIVNETTKPPVNTPSGITLSVLATHNSESDCWVAYNGKVYDVTSYLPMHPGGVKRIANQCGTSDGFTRAFEGQHGTSKVSILKNVATLMGDFSN